MSVRNHNANISLEGWSDARKQAQRERPHEVRYYNPVKIYEWTFLDRILWHIERAHHLDGYIPYPRSQSSTWRIE